LRPVIVFLRWLDSFSLFSFHQLLFNPLAPLPRRRPEQSTKNCSMGCVGAKSVRFAVDARWQSKAS
jgi:hypothetical protein